MFERALCEEAGLLPLGDPIDMVLQVDDAEEEGHYAAECERDVLHRVVIVLHGIPDLEDAEDVGDHTGEKKDEAKHDEGSRVRRGTNSDSNATRENSSGVHGDEDHGGVFVDEPAGPIGEDQTPDPSEQDEDEADKSADDHDDQHKNPVNIRRQRNEVLRRRSKNLCGSWNWNISQDLGNRNPVGHSFALREIGEQDATLLNVLL